MRLGFAVKVLGQPDLKTYDSRRWSNHPHLSVSLIYVRDIFLYLERHRIRMYRLSSNLAPYVSHPELPQFHNQVEECLCELKAIGEMARNRGLRLSFHPPSYLNLASPDEALAAKSLRWLSALARILDAMEMGPESVVVLHLGGAYRDKRKSLERFIRRWKTLPESARRRVALENDDSAFSVADIKWVHDRTGIPLVFDYLHHLNNPGGKEVVEALAICLGSWPRDVRPKVHFSTPRTAMKLVELGGKATGRVKKRAYPPRPTEHADFIDPFQFIAFCEKAKEAGLWGFDVMLEARAKDLALLRLREDLRKFAPELVDDAASGRSENSPAILP